MTKKPHSTDREEENSPAKFSRRTTLASLLGLSGFSVSNGQTVQATNSNSRPWNQDVDAQGHTLSNLGSLSTANNPDEITDFAGENLSISDSGVLNATATNGGIGERGEKIHLASIFVEERVNVAGFGSDYRITNRSTRAISTGQFSFSNISNTYLSISGWAYGSEGDLVSLRLYDKTTDSPILGSEVEIETEGLEDSSGIQSGIQIPFYGPKAEYESTEPHLIHLQYKTTATTTPDEFATSGGIMIHVWGEV